MQNKMKFSPIFRFSDWPNTTIPSVAAGVYAIWQDNNLIYCGMSGREILKNQHKKIISLEALNPPVI